MLVLGDLAGCFLFQKLSWAYRDRDWISQADGAIPHVFSPQRLASKPVITNYQHPLFGSWHSLPKATFCPRLKFPFGGCGIQNQSRPLAELLNVGWKDQHVRMRPCGTSQWVHICMPRNSWWIFVFSNCDGSEEFMQMFFKKFRARLFGLQVILGLHSVSCCFGKKYCALHSRKCPAILTTVNPYASQWVQAVGVDSLSLNPTSTVPWASYLSFLYPLPSSVTWE